MRGISASASQPLGCLIGHSRLRKSTAASRSTTRTHSCLRPVRWYLTLWQVLYPAFTTCQLLSCPSQFHPMAMSCRSPLRAAAAGSRCLRPAEAPFIPQGRRKCCIASRCGHWSARGRHSPLLSSPLSNPTMADARQLYRLQGEWIDSMDSHPVSLPRVLSIVGPCKQVDVLR